MAAETPGTFARITKIFKARKTLNLLVKRDLKVRYADSVLGYVWSIIDPLMMALIFWFVFTVIFQRGVGNEPYIVFLLAAMLPFNWFQNAIGDTTRGITGSARLIKSTALPREIWVIRLVLSKGVEFVLSLPVLLAFAIAAGASFSWYLLLYIPAILLQVILITGLGLMIAPLVVMVRDVERLVKIVLRFMFYATPVIYGLSDIYKADMPEILRQIYLLNPMTGLVSMYRSGFFAEQLHWDAVIVSAVVSLILFFAGWKVFSQLESAVLKEI